MRLPWPIVALGSPETDSYGYPVDYFEGTAGSFANEPLEAPLELPMQTREAW